MTKPDAVGVLRIASAIVLVTAGIVMVQAGWNWYYALIPLGAAGGVALDNPWSWVLTGGLGLFVMGLTALSLGSGDSAEDLVLQIALVAACLALPLVRYVLLIRAVNRQ